MRFRAEQHLRRQSEIRAVREQGRRVDCRAFTLWWKLRPADSADASQNAPDSIRAAAPKTPRVCVIASTAAVGGAVLPAQFQRHLHIFQCGECRDQLERLEDESDFLTA